MSHEVESMFYAGDTPWHGLGYRLPANVSLVDALTHAKLDWTVNLQRMFIRDKTQAARTAVEVPGMRAVVRSVDSSVLGVVSDKYSPIQNRDLFDVFDKAVDGRAVWHTAGSLRGGCEVWALAQVPGGWRVAGEQHRRYLLATAGHDGKHEARFLPTDVRVVCKNTQGMALDSAEKDEILSVRHVGDVGARLATVAGSFEAALGAFNGYQERMARLLDTILSPQRETEILEQVIEGDSSRAESTRTAIRDLAHYGTGNRAIAGTAYGLLQGTTEYVDHHRMQTATAEKRTVYATSGAGSRLKQRMEATLLRETHSLGLLDSIIAAS